MMFIELIREGKMSNEGDKLLPCPVMGRVVVCHRKWVPKNIGADGSYKTETVIAKRMSTKPWTVDADTSRNCWWEGLNEKEGHSWSDSTVDRWEEITRATPVVNREDVRDDMREAFEEWYGYYGFQADWSDEHGCYQDKQTQFMFAAYQAATAYAETKYLPVIEKLVEALKMAHAWIECVSPLQPYSGISERQYIEDSLALAEQLLKGK